MLICPYNPWLKPITVFLHPFPRSHKAKKKGKATAVMNDIQRLVYDTYIIVNGALPSFKRKVNTFKIFTTSRHSKYFFKELPAPLFCVLCEFDTRVKYTVLPFNPFNAKTIKGKYLYIKAFVDKVGLQAFIIHAPKKGSPLHLTSHDERKRRERTVKSKPNIQE